MLAGWPPTLACTAMPAMPWLDLVKRLRDMEETKDRQIANFTRQD